MRKFEKLTEMEIGNLVFGNSRGLWHVEPRMEYQDAFVKFLYKIGCDMYGYADGKDFIDNDVFTLRPYYWGEDEEQAALPNFVFKPAGIEISWYKYPMRDAYCNQNVCMRTFKGILKRCEKEMERCETNARNHRKRKQ